MLKVRIFITLLTALALSNAHAQCIYPEDVAIPDGAVSTYEEMNLGQTYVKEYMAEMEGYLECLEEELDESANGSAASSNAGSDSPGEDSGLQQRLAAINAMESVAAKFNEQVRAYKLANP